MTDGNNHHEAALSRQEVNYGNPFWHGTTRTRRTRRAGHNSYAEPAGWDLRTLLTSGATEERGDGEAEAEEREEEAAGKALWLRQDAELGEEREAVKVYPLPQRLTILHRNDNDPLDIP